MLRFSGLYQENCSDLYVTCQVFAEGKPLALPVRTSYKAFSTRWKWVLVSSFIFSSQHLLHPCVPSYHINTGFCCRKIIFSSSYSSLFLLSCAVGTSGCGCRSSTQTFLKALRWPSLCGTSTGPAEPSPWAAPPSLCLANMGESSAVFASQGKITAALMLTLKGIIQSYSGSQGSSAFSYSGGMRASLFQIPPYCSSALAQVSWRDLSL